MDSTHYHSILFYCVKLFHVGYLMSLRNDFSIQGMNPIRLFK